MEQFFEKPNELRMLSRRFLAEFRSSAEQTHYRKGSIWLGSGQVCRELLLLQTGCMAARQTYHGTETIGMLMGAGQTVIPAVSLFQEKRSVYTYQFLSDASVFTLPAPALEALQIQYADARFLINYFLAEEVRRLAEHSLMLAHSDPKERIAYARTFYKEPFNLLSREEQASFLGLKKRMFQNYL